MTLPAQTSQPSSVQSQHFLLKWNNHRSNMVNVFESLLQSENLVDVTIAVEGKFIKAHKIVLSACSPYFQAMFVNHSPSERYPVLIFHDMKHAHLKTLLDFMYRGEISIDEKDLGEVLKVAEALSIRGLSSFESDDEEDKPEGQQSGSNGSSATTQQSLSTSTSHLNNASGGSNGVMGSSSHTNGPSLSSEGSNNVTDQCTNNVGNSSGGVTVSSPSGGGSNHVSSYGGGTPVSNGGGGRKQKRGGQGDKRKDNHKREASPMNHHLGGSSASISAIAQQLDKAVVESKLFEKKHPQQLQGAKGQGDKVTRSLSPPVKKKRGRPKSKPTTEGVQQQQQIHHQPQVQAPSSSKLTFTSTELKKGTLPVVGRQGVRRRLPRRFSGVPTRLKRVKLNKHGGSGGDGGSGDGGEFGDDPLLDEGMLFDPSGGDCEPLSEMSVRGLDLFKYASVEDGLYRCIECEKLSIPKTFKNKYSFQRHAFLYHEGNMRKVFPCPVCSREFSRPDKMKNHMKGVHEGGGKGKGSPSDDLLQEEEEAESSGVVTAKVEETSEGGELSDEEREDESCDYEG